MSTTESRKRQTMHRRKTIVDAAHKIFWQKGYTGATIPEIAEEAELAPGSLYLYFPSKAALYVELLSEGYAMLLDKLRDAVEQADDPSVQADALVAAFFDFAKQSPDYFDILFFVLQQDTGTWEQTFDVNPTGNLAKTEQACKLVVAGVLEQAADISPDHLPAAVDATWSMLAGVVFCFRNRENYPQVTHEATRLILAAVTGKTIAG